MSSEVVLADPVPHLPLVPQPRGNDAPLSFGQERLWVLQRVAPRSPAYNIPVTLRISGSLDTEALERAVGEIVRRHEALRTVIVATDGVPAQRVLPFAGFRLPVHDLTAMRPDAREEETRRLVSEDRRTPFAVDGAPSYSCLPSKSTRTGEHRKAGCTNCLRSALRTGFIGFVGLTP